MHPSVEEFFRWRNGRPLNYPSLEVMPAVSAEILDHLIAKYGRAAAEKLGLTHVAPARHYQLLQQEAEKAYLGISFGGRER